MSRVRRAADAISTMATRLSFLVVPWLVLASSASVTSTVAAVGVQTLAYLAASPLGARLAHRYAHARLSLFADLSSAVVLASVAFAYANLAPLLIVVALVGAVRAISDRTRDVAFERQPSITDVDELPAPPPRESLISVLTLIGGAALGLMVVLLGAAGGLWLTAVACAVCAGLGAIGWGAAGLEVAGLEVAGAPAALAADAADRADRDPTERSQIGPEAEDRTDRAGALTAALSEQPAPTPDGGLATRGLATRALAELRRSPFISRLAVALFCVSLLGQAGAILLLGALHRDLLADEVAGFAAGSFVIGAVGVAAVFNAYAYQPTRWGALALGYLIGGGTLLVAGGTAPVTLLLFAAPMVAGFALGSVTPSTGMVVAERVPAMSRGRAGGLMATVAQLGLPLGTLAGAWLALHTGLALAIGMASVLYLAITLTPLAVLRAWRTVMPEQAPPGVRGRNSEKLKARMSVTLAYADGQWLVEVRRGRALLGSRHAVNSADALRTLALLDVPTVHHGIGRVLSTDQDEAARQVQRARNELSELEARLSGLKEMVDLTETPTQPRRPPDREVHSR